MSLVKKMKEQENLTERERDIAKYILEHPGQVLEMSSRALGHETFTSAASVTRFCQKLGVKGLQEFKLQLVAELRSGRLEEDSEEVLLSERENVVTMVRKATKIQQRAVEETQKNLSYSRLLRIGRMIAEAESVDFYAYDTNIFLAQYGRSLFYHAGKRSSVYSETNLQGLHALMPSDGHVAVAISHTGKNRRIAEIEKLLRRNRAKVIAITSDPDGIVGRNADEVLTAAGTEKVEEFWTSMFFASCKYLLDILYGIEFSKNYQDNLLLNRTYENSGRKLLWSLEQDEEQT